MNDVRNIIQLLPEKYYHDCLRDIDNILENLIIRNNMTYNTFIFNHIIYYNKTDEFKDKIISSIKKHIISNVKNIRIHFRGLNKKNQMSINNFNSYFESFYKLIIKLNSMFQHIFPNNQNTHKKWGDNIIINYSIDCIIRILCDDIIFKSIIVKYIKDNDSDMYLFNKYMKDISEYTDNPNKFYNTFINTIDEALVEMIPSNYIDGYINDIYNFNILYKYYMDAFYNLKYITKTHSFDKMKNNMKEKLEQIISSNNITYVKTFITTYKKELVKLINHIKIELVFLSCKPTNIDTFIDYYLTLTEISVYHAELNIIVDTCIKTEVSKFFNTPESIEYLANIINTMIINKEVNSFYYTIGYYIVNKDEFIAHISQKFMERIIYTQLNNSIELEHYSILLNIFKNEQKVIYKYKMIYNDLIRSEMFNSMSTDIKSRTIITSYDIWNINYKVGNWDTIVDFNIFTKHIQTLNIKYNQLFNSKKIIFYPHIGNVDINIGSTNLIVLPAHMFILEQFDSFDKVISYNELYETVKLNMNKYPEVFIKKLIDSLFVGGVLNNNIQIRKDMKPFINMVEIFNTMNNTSIIIKKIMYEELCHERIDIISTIINHYVKLKDYNIDELYYIVNKDISLFEMDKELFQQAIDKMIKNEYIINNNSMLKKLIF